MTDRTPPDSLPPEDDDSRSDLEQAIDSGKEDIERSDTTSPLEPTVSPDTAGGAGGVVRNQDDSAQ